MRAPEIRIGQDELIVDNFAGGGGASLGIETALRRHVDVAINHDPEALAVHRSNHPETKHYCENIWQVDPRKACKSRPAFVWFSPDCKHFSKAKGGKPVDKKIRGLAWVVVTWLKAVKPRVFGLENVEEFEEWGPLLANGRPDPDKLGLTFKIWLGKIKALGYHVEWRQILAADHGAATLRWRFFLVGRCDGQPIVWPEGTHGASSTPWRTAAECIDWSLPTYSIFLTPEEARRYGVRRPLAENTMRRIFRGFDRFVVNNPRPYIVGLAHGEHQRAPGARSHDLGEPIRTIHAGGNNHALVLPYLTEHANASSPRSFNIREPLRTQCAQVKGGHFALVAPYFTARYGEREGQAPRAISVDRPTPTIVPTQNGAQLVAAFLAKHYGDTGQRPGSRMDEPVATITASDHNALVASSLIKLKGTCQDGQQLDLPLHTVQAGGNHYAESRAFLVKYYGTNDANSLSEPLRAVTSKERFGLVTVHGEEYVVADIGMRMLSPRELYRAQGFPDSYVIDPVIDGKKLSKEAQVRCVGNSVCPPVAAAIARAQFTQQAIEVAA